MPNLNSLLAWLLSICIAFPVNAFALDNGNSSATKNSKTIAQTLDLVKSIKKSAYLTLQISKQLAPELALDRWISYFESQGIDLHKMNFQDFVIKGNQYRVPGIKEPFSVLSDGRIEHLGKIWKVNFKESPESNVEQMKKAWGLNGTNASIIDLILPRAEAGIQELKYAAGMTVIAVVVAALGLGLLTLQNKFPNGVFFASVGLILVILTVAAFAKDNGIDATKIVFSCKDGFILDGQDVTEKIMSYATNDDENIAAKKFGTPQDALNKIKGESCDLDPSKTEKAVNDILLPSATVAAKAWSDSDGKITHRDIKKIDKKDGTPAGAHQ